MNLISNIKKYAQTRAKELKKMAQTNLSIESAEANVAGQKIVFRANVEQKAAWRLYVEINTRVATQPLKANQGLLREALNSLYKIFDVTREILKEAGPEVAQGKESLGFYSMAILNDILRPFLTKWHPMLLDWENQRESSQTMTKHEKEWAHSKTLRKELEILRKDLIKYCNALQVLSESQI